ncbi:hypothetical protein LPUS_05843 [Lasallia pustulata]|uniref:Oxidoreductase acuF-like C2H2 type zinc-finger domain-containing protein n=1 Tax=Lasallia pustulata TaxID=136370 RepID=A0A1W5CZZ1_9LECA|nr:hypothetical protein LPUS_05843 [Lasallia pustulata]
MTSGRASAIATQARSCIDDFKILSSLVQDLGHQSQWISNSMICDELGRYQIWAGNIGAFQEAQLPVSLDYRLRAQPKIAKQIIELLEDLEETLKDACAIASGERRNRLGSSLNHDEDDKPPDNCYAYGQETIVDQQRSEFQELFESIGETITSLFKMSMMIRNATPRDRYHKAANALKEPFDDRYDIDHVGHKFPRLATEDSEWLKIRLGKAITQRRHYIRYCREHRDRLSREPKPGLTNYNPANSERQAKIMDLANAESRPDLKAYTVAARLTGSIAPTSASTLVPANLETAEEASDEAQSQTSYATLVGVDDASSRLHVVSLKKVTKGVYPFECPYCGEIQNIRQERSWR